MQQLVWTLEIPITVDGEVIGHFPDIDVVMQFNGEDGDLEAVQIADVRKGHAPLVVDKTTKDTNGRAIWLSALKAKPNLAVYYQAA